MAEEDLTAGFCPCHKKKTNYGFQQKTYLIKNKIYNLFVIIAKRMLMINCNWYDKLLYFVSNFWKYLTIQYFLQNYLKKLFESFHKYKFMLT